MPQNIVGGLRFYLQQEVVMHFITMLFEKSGKIQSLSQSQKWMEISTESHVVFVECRGEDKKASPKGLVTHLR